MNDEPTNRREYHRAWRLRRMFTDAMAVDYSKACTVQFMHTTTGQILMMDFYGYSADEIRSVPCPIDLTAALRRRGLNPYQWTSNLFWITTLPLGGIRQQEAKIA